MPTETLTEKWHLRENLKAVKDQPYGYVKWSNQGRRNNRCKGPEAGAFPMRSKKMEEAKEAGRVRGRW